MIQHWLIQRMQSFGNEPALVWDDSTVSYAQLLDDVGRWRHLLQGSGLPPHAAVVIEGTFSPQACALLLACLDGGLVAVPLTPGMRAQRSEFVAISQAQATFSFAADDTWQIEKHPTTVTHPLLSALSKRSHAGLVIFSSGSSGNPKAVLHDFDALLEKFRTARTKKTVLTFLLFDHIGGIDTLMNTLANGGLLVTTPSRDPDVVCGLLAKHQVHTLPTSPTFLNWLLVSGAIDRHDLSHLDVIAYGTEPMPESTLTRLKAALPHVKLVQTYGLSELGVLRSRSGGDGTWLSFTHDGYETKVVDGVLWVRTPTAMLGYLNAPDLMMEGGWLNTQDAVEVDGNRLRILGRVTDLINVGGQKVYPAEVETVLLELSNVADVAVFGEKNPLTGAAVAAKVNLVSPEPLDAFKKRLRAFCRERLAAYKIPLRIELTEEKQFGARFKKVRKAT